MQQDYKPSAGEHPITPPPELVEQWIGDWHKAEVKSAAYSSHIATQAARWGADQELKATLGLMATLNIRGVDYIRNARRPKPSSLKKQALHELEDVYNRDKIEDSTYDTIRRALEALDD